MRRKRGLAGPAGDMRKRPAMRREKPPIKIPRKRGFPESDLLNTQEIGREKAREILNLARDILQKPARIEPKYWIPDMFFAMLFKNAGTNFFYSKEHLMNAIGYRLRRPEFSSVHIQVPQHYVSRPNEAKAAIGSIKKILLLRGSAYIKPGGRKGSDARQVVRLQLSQKGLGIRTEDPEMSSMLAKNLGSGAVFSNSGRGIFIPTNRRNLGETIRGVFLGSGSFGGSRLVESEIRAPRYQGKKRWEIRIFVQNIGGKVVAPASFARTSEGKVVVNVARGGKIEPSMDVLRDVCARAYPRAGRSETGALAGRLLQRMKQDSGAIAEILKPYAEERRKKLIPLFPNGEFFPSELACDFAAEFDPKTGHLEPVLVEAQPISFVEHLKLVDERGYRVLKANEEEMARHGRQVIENYFSEILD